jgi:hypothetical protein
MFKSGCNINGEILPLTDTLLLKNIQASLYHVLIIFLLQLYL